MAVSKSTPSPGGRLDLGESRGVVVEQGALFALDPAQQVTDRLGGIEGDAHRKGVDQHADDSLRAREVGGSAGNRCAEDDVGLAG